MKNIVVSKFQKFISQKKLFFNFFYEMYVVKSEVSCKLRMENRI